MKDHMKVTFSRRWLITGGAIALVALILFLDRAEDYIGHVSYPLGTWRMDLDDALVGFGTILIGTAAIWKVWLLAYSADKRSRKVEHEINGGMAEAVGHHVVNGLNDADLEVGLWRRVDALEETITDCREREKECLKKNEDLRAWVITRLDYSTDGREGSRS